MSPFPNEYVLLYTCGKKFKIKKIKKCFGKYVYLIQSSFRTEKKSWIRMKCLLAEIIRFPSLVENVYCVCFQLRKRRINSEI